MNVSILTTDGDYVTLCEVKSYLKVNGTDRDGFIVDCIKSAVSFVEKKIDRSEANKSYHMIERATGSFMRSVELHMNLIKEEGIEASFKNGVLTIYIPKTENATSQSRKIAISSFSEK